MKNLFFKIFINNSISNFFIRVLKLEKVIYDTKKTYIHFKTNTAKSIQENAGYSNREDINEVLDKSKQDLRNAIHLNVKENAIILDIGCGPGMYLNLLKENLYQLHATDINESMISEAKKNVPQATYYTGNFIDITINQKFDFIYCIGVLIYIGRNDLDVFIKKVYNLLNDGGTFYLNYPHAITLGDLYYSDLTYIQYSPKLIGKLIHPYFNIQVHHHAFDGRKVDNYDKTPYKSLNPNTNRTYKNSYLLIAKKKTI